jgi:hypothetical protein
MAIVQGMVAGDWTIATNGDIRYTGPNHTTANASYATVIQFHRWLMDHADDAVADSVSGDLLDITDTTPSERQTDNIIQLIAPYNIDQASSEHLYDGSIIQNGGDDIWDGLVVIAAPGMSLQIQQNGAVISAANSFWNSQNNGQTYTGLNYDVANGYSHRFMIKVRTLGVDIDGRRLVTQTRVWNKTFSEFKINGTSRGNNVSALTYATDNNNAKSTVTISGYGTAAGNLVTSGYNALDINANSVDEYYYSKWDIDKGGGRTINDFYERMKYLTRATETTTLFGLPGEQFRGVTHEFTTDTPTGTFSAVETITWGTLISSPVIADTAGNFTFTSVAPFTITPGQLVRISGTFGGSGTITGYSNPTTYQVKSTNGTTSFQLVTTAGAALTTTAGTPTGITVELQYGSGRMLAINSTTAPTKVWTQLTLGVPPTDNMRIRGETSTATCLVNVTVTERPLSQPFCGQSTGSALIGGYGLTLVTADLTSADLITSLDGNPLNPPNNQNFYVTGVVVSEDYVLVGPKAGGDDIDYAQLTLNTTLVTDNITSVVTTTAIPLDTPATGTIRVLDDAGVYRRLVYTSWVGSTFTIDPAASDAYVGGVSDFLAGEAATAPKNVFISYIDKLATATSESFQATFQSNRNLWVRVRDGGGTPIKTFSTAGVFGSAGGSVGVIRTPDV